MERQSIDAGWLTLRPFTTADVDWVYEVSLDPAVQYFVGVPSPYLPEHAAFFVERVAVAGWDSGQRAEVGNLASRRVAEKAGFLIEATLRQRLVHRGKRVDAWVGSLLSGPSAKTCT